MKVRTGESHDAETDAVQTKDSCTSECLPPAFSACVWEGGRRETLHAELSGVLAELPRQFLGVCMLQNPQLI